MKEPTPSNLLVFIVFSLINLKICARFNSCNYFIFHINVANIFVITNECRRQNSYDAIKTHQHAVNLYSV